MTPIGKKTRRIRDAVSNHWFFPALALALVLALRFPEPAGILKQFRIVTMGIAGVFFLTGFSLDTSAIQGAKTAGALVLALLSSSVLFPAAGFCIARLFFNPASDAFFGTCLISAVPVTLALGTILTATAGGNTALSLMLCVTSNLLGIAVAPVTLMLMTPASPAAKVVPAGMIFTLVTVIALPAAAGLMAKKIVKTPPSPGDRRISIYSQIVVLLIFYNTVALGFSGGRASLPAIFSAMLLLHGTALVFNLGASRLFSLTKKDRPVVIIHASQKTPSVAYVIWAGHFLSLHPGAMALPVVYHLIQITMDMAAAKWLGKRR